MFLEQEELQQGDIITIKNNTSLVSGMYKLKDSLLFDDTNSSHSFLLWYSHCFMGACNAIHYVKGTVFILQHLLQASIIVSSLWLIRGNLKGTVFICGKQSQPCSCKGAYLFHGTGGSNFSLQPPHSFMITAQKKFPADLVTFTEESLNGKLHFLCSG